MKKYIFLFIILLIAPVVHASTSVSSFDDLKTCIDNGEIDIIINNDFNFTDSIIINNNIKINGNNKKLTRDISYLGTLFQIQTEGSLELSNITIDGNAPNWEMDYDNRYYTGSNHSSAYVRVPTINYENDLVSDDSIINNSGNLKFEAVNVNNILTREEGGVVKGAGNNTFNNSSFTHIGSYKQGAVFSLSGGTTIIRDCIIKDNSGGAVSNEVTRGGAIFSVNLEKLTIDNVQFINNYSQTDGGALYIRTHDFEILNSLFKENKVGNDGSAITLNNGSNQYSLIENSIFDGNHGFAEEGQSMGTIYYSEWIQTVKENPSIIRNCIFRNNIAATGGMIADASFYSSILVESTKVYDNRASSGGGIYSQGVTYTINDSEFYNNSVDYEGGAMKIIISNHTTLNRTKIYNNKAGNGGGVFLGGYHITINDSYIYNNTADKYGGGFFYGSMNDAITWIEVKGNSVITNNNSLYGGGMALVTRNDNYIRVNMQDQPKVYNNHASTAGDDFTLINEVENPEKYNRLNFIPASDMNISGINGWYHDNEGSRYIDEENPEEFTPEENYETYNIHLKAGGFSTLEYDLLGGKNDEIKPITIKYGALYVIDDNIPVKNDYRFKGWNTKEDGSGSWLYAGDSYDGSEGVILYAQYEPLKGSNMNTNPNTNPNTKNNFYMICIVVSLLIGFCFVTYVRRNKHIKNNNDML